MPARPAPPRTNVVKEHLTLAALHKQPSDSRAESEHPVLRKKVQRAEPSQQSALTCRRSQMNRLFAKLSVLAFMSMATAAPSVAADVPAPFPGNVYAPVFSWSGFYLGLNAGYGWGRTDWNSAVTTGTTNPGGGLFGGTV